MLVPARCALVLTVDGLHSGFLGPYGNTWVQTPEFDALAAEGFVFDQALIAHPRLENAFDALWSVCQANAPAGQPAVSLAQVLADAGIATCLITDDASLAAHPLAAGFAECVLLPTIAPRKAALDIEETVLAQAFATAAERLGSLASPFLVWIHVRGLTAPWDAPMEFRTQYADPEDPPTPDFVAVPDERLPENYDPDELLGIVHAYAGQVSLLDTCLGVLRGAVSESPASSQTLFCVMGARGFALGEHGQIGGQDGPLYSERLQIPWLMQFPDGCGALDRSSALVQQQDLPATLLAWWQLDAAAPVPGSHDLLPVVHDDRLSVRDCAVVTASPQEQVLRTPAWLLRASGPADSPRLELFTKPSDRWDVNQVADRASEIADEMFALLAKCRAADPTVHATPLGARLLEPVD